MISINRLQVLKWKEQQQREWTNPKTQEVIIFYTQSLWCRLPYKKPVYFNVLWKSKTPFEEQAEITDAYLHMEQYKNKNGKYITNTVLDNWEKYQAKDFQAEFEKKHHSNRLDESKKIEKLEQEDKKVEEWFNDLLNKDTTQPEQDVNLDFLDDKKEGEK